MHRRTHDNQVHRSSLRSRWLSRTQMTVGCRDHLIYIETNLEHKLKNEMEKLSLNNITSKKTSTLIFQKTQTNPIDHNMFSKAAD